MTGLEGYSIYPGPGDLSPVLQRYCMEAGNSGIYIFHHQFCVCPFPLAFPVPLEKLLHEREEAAMAALAAGDTDSFLLRHEKPYRPEALMDLVNEGHFDSKPEEYWRLVRKVWVDSDLPEDDPYWAEMLEADIGSVQAMMGEGDRAQLAAMPEVIQVWRGVEGMDETSAREAVTAGHSWSIDPKIAERFAKSFARSSGEAWVARADIPKARVVAYLADRGEAEIILRPSDIAELEFDLISLGSKSQGFSDLQDKLLEEQHNGETMTFTDKIKAHLESFKNDEEGHKLFPHADWRYEVDNDDTSLGYDDWLSDKIDFEVDDVADTVNRFIYRGCKATDGEISEIEFNRDVVDTFSTLRIIDDEAVDRANGFLGEAPEKPVFGESFGSVPSDVAADLSRIAHLGMVFFEGRCSAEKLISVMAETATKHGMEGEGAEAVRARSGDQPEETPQP
ncbi:hypothetical protein ACGYLO_11030 [Sulfitobacter sp. 1A13353]|uniref:hypothetical protein n=1 Tax=Sulfitobacter sp. 1A13353 TaxID=3368568 RepID=UPI003744CF2E